MNLNKTYKYGLFTLYPFKKIDSKIRTDLGIKFKKFTLETNFISVPILQTI